MQKQLAENMEDDDDTSYQAALWEGWIASNRANAYQPAAHIAENASHAYGIKLVKGQFVVR